MTDTGILITWRERPEAMTGVCRNCHNHTFVDNFYQQLDSLVTLIYSARVITPAL